MYIKIAANIVALIKTIQQVKYNKKQIDIMNFKYKTKVLAMKMNTFKLLEN